MNTNTEDDFADLDLQQRRFIDQLVQCTSTSGERSCSPVQREPLSVKIARSTVSGFKTTVKRKGKQHPWRIYHGTSYAPCKHIQTTDSL